jgi:hypothetical protein
MIKKDMQNIQQEKRLVMAMQRNGQEKIQKKRAAQYAVSNAVRSGKLIPLPCFICGIKAEAHHPDYDQPLSVVWLCPSHHKQAHALVKK